MVSIKKALAFGVAALISLNLLCEALIIDHKCTDVSKVPKSYIEKAKSTFKISYGHTSHGSQIVSGMQALKKSDAKLFAFANTPAENSLLFFDKTPGGDLGNPDRVTWAERTRELLRGNDKGVNLVMWSWCGQVSNASEKDIQTYLDLMSGLENEFPDVKFVYMTGHLDGSGKDGNLNKRNDQIRDFCRKNGKILFDFADIESYDPDGKVNYMEKRANDACEYIDNGAKKN